ncbi:angiogenic factor with G patch and FHA domains 1 isoform X3 [Sphaerodactylus townsendi]|uniref:angiogenic factor with G patch and FHA domains 1 isoform X3 n=1 Tax=Sphaerodactylus townsendi TaxID=933632 RepID=UPI002026A67E|nr:angiogenic factor with G patch and FHA domains 1 isoform X3 [Sphaerodactylus townsendi]
MTEHPEPCVEVGALREKVAALEVELESCRGRLEREKKLRLKTQASLAKLRREIEVHSKDSNDKKTSEKSTSTVEVQTENDGAWSHADYYYYSYYNSTELLPDSSKVPDQPNSDNDGSNSNCKEQLPSSDHSAVNGTRHNEHEMQDNVTCDVQESEDALLAEGTLAESLRAAAEAAVSQTGFTYDEGTGLYYDHSTGFYYNSETQLYYDPTTGIYYYCDVESGRYQFHSRVDLQSYGTSAAQQQTKDKKSKKKRRDAERPKASEHKVHQLTETMANLKISSSGLAAAGKDGDKIWPPCIRVIVIRSPVLQMGSLYIITAVKPATIGREKDMEHTLQIPEAGVSKFHAEVYFDHELQNYVLVDQGSQNGTVLNGNQILEPKAKSDPYVLEHGDEVKIGETVLSFHIHPGSETCDGCEPGQVRAHLRLDQKSESSIGPALTKEEKELNRRKVLKQIRVKYGLQNAEYENDNVVKNRKYKDRAGKRREMVGSEGTFHRDDAPASVHVEISDSNRGHKMLEKMGWKKGEGLGKSGSGMKDPITLQLHRKQAGLGASIPISAENVQMVNTKNKRNWEKARERFAENFQDPKPEKNVSKNLSWVRETAE